MAGRYLGRILLALAFPLSFTGIAGAEEQPPEADPHRAQPDEICKLLFETYIARQGGISTETVLAASHIVAERGRNNDFWKSVLAELKSENKQSEIGCVRVLGKMLEIDAGERDLLQMQKATGRTAARVASVRLGPEVVAELIQRGQKADRFRADHYAIALARARVPEATDFFKSILRKATRHGDPNAPVLTSWHHSESTRFHAAAGLAQLGDPEGIQWLIDNSQQGPRTVENAWPRGAVNHNLSKCCVAALWLLTGERFETKAQWKAWWQTSDRKLLAGRYVVLVDW